MFQKIFESIGAFGTREMLGSDKINSGSLRDA